MSLIVFDVTATQSTMASVEVPAKVAAAAAVVVVVASHRLLVEIHHSEAVKRFNSKH